MASTWPDTFNESPDGARTVFTLVSGLSPVNEDVVVDRLPQSPLRDYAKLNSTFAFTVAPTAGAIMECYFQYTTTSPPPSTTPGVAGVTTLAALRLAAQQRADMVNSNFVTTSEWTSNINSGYYKLYNLLVQKYAEGYYSALDSTNKPYQFTTNGTSEYFALPDGSSTYKMPDGSTAPAFFKLNGVDLWISSAQTTPSQWFTLHRFNQGERNRWTLPNAIAPYGYIALRYRLEANKLWLRPLPQASQLIQVRYVPRLTALASDSDSADLVSGWEEYIVIDAAIKALQKEESDTTMLRLELADLTKQIECAADNRDPGEPQTVVDVATPGFFGGFGNEGMI